MSLDALFVRGQEALWVRRPTSSPLELVLQGPGTLRRTGQFESETELQAFAAELRTRLVRAGWMPERLGGSRRAPRL